MLLVQQIFRLLLEQRLYYALGGQASESDKNDQLDEVHLGLKGAHLALIKEFLTNLEVV